MSLFLILDDFACFFFFELASFLASVREADQAAFAAEDNFLCIKKYSNFEEALFLEPDYTYRMDEQ